MIKTIRMTIGINALLALMFVFVANNNLFSQENAESSEEEGTEATSEGESEGTTTSAEEEAPPVKSETTPVKPVKKTTKPPASKPPVKKAPANKECKGSGKYHKLVKGSCIPAAPCVPIEPITITVKDVDTPAKIPVKIALGPVTTNDSSLKPLGLAVTKIATSILKKQTIYKTVVPDSIMKTHFKNDMKIKAVLKDINQSKALAKKLSANAIFFAEFVVDDSGLELSFKFTISSLIGAFEPVIVNAKVSLQGEGIEKKGAAYADNAYKLLKQQIQKAIAEAVKAEQDKVNDVVKVIQKERKEACEALEEAEALINTYVGYMKELDIHYKEEPIVKLAPGVEFEVSGEMLKEVPGIGKYLKKIKFKGPRPLQIDEIWYGIVASAYVTPKGAFLGTIVTPQVRMYILFPKLKPGEYVWNNKEELQDVVVGFATGGGITNANSTVYGNFFNGKKGTAKLVLEINPETTAKLHPIVGKFVGSAMLVHNDKKKKRNKVVKLSITKMKFQEPRTTVYGSFHVGIPLWWEGVFADQTSMEAGTGLIFEVRINKPKNQKLRHDLQFGATFGVNINGFSAASGSTYKAAYMMHLGIPLRYMMSLNGKGFKLGIGGGMSFDVFIPTDSNVDGYSAISPHLRIEFGPAFAPKGKKSKKIGFFGDIGGHFTLGDTSVKNVLLNPDFGKGFFIRAGLNLMIMGK